MHLKRSLLISHRLQGSQLESSATAKTCFGSFHSYQVSKFRAQKYLVVSHNFQWPCMGPPSMLNDGKASALRCTLRCIISSVKPPQTVVKSVWYNELCLRSTTMSAWLTSHHRPHQTTWLILAWLALWHHVTRIPTFGASRPRATIRLQLLAQHRLLYIQLMVLGQSHTCTLAHLHTHTNAHTHTNQQTNKPTNPHTNHKSYIQLMANNTLAHAHEQFSASFWPGTNISLNFLDCKINRLCRTTVFCPLAPVFCHFWTVIYWSVS